MHTVIVPGVGGSDYDHWQSWLQRQLMCCSRVQQQDWNDPVLNQWVSNFIETVSVVSGHIQIVAHSFGCLTAVAAIYRHPELARKIKKLILVAPANPARFGDQGFARNSQNDYASYFHQIKLKIPTDMIISENDPWLSFEDAKKLAHSWQVCQTNIGAAGHINVASGFGPFPEIYNHMYTEQMDSEKLNSLISNTDDNKLYYKFAI